VAGKILRSVFFLRVAKVLTSAGFVEPHVLLEILVCKTLAQKLIFLPGFLLRPERDMNIG